MRLRKEEIPYGETPYSSWERCQADRWTVSVDLRDGVETKAGDKVSVDDRSRHD